MKCDFSLKHYQEMLKKAKKSDFNLTNFRDYEKIKNKNKIIILRHDIDYSTERALKLAEIENRLGIRSTYFIRVHGEYYSPFSEESFSDISKIINLGHEIGLHFEAGYLSKKFKMDAVKLFLKEKKVLEDIFDIKIISAGEHAYLGRAKNFWKNHFFSKIKKSKVKILHYPQEKVYKKLHYLSDSCGIWKEGCLCENLEKYSQIQVLIHGDHWGPNAKEEINKFIKYGKI